MYLLVYIVLLQSQRIPIWPIQKYNLPVTQTILTQTEKSLGALGIELSANWDSEVGMCSRVNDEGLIICDSYKRKHRALMLGSDHTSLACKQCRITIPCEQPSNISHRTLKRNLVICPIQLTWLFLVFPAFLRARGRFSRSLSGITKKVNSLGTGQHNSAYPFPIAFTWKRRFLHPVVPSVDKFANKNARKTEIFWKPFPKCSFWTTGIHR